MVRSINLKALAKWPARSLRYLFSDISRGDGFQAVLILIALQITTAKLFFNSEADPAGKFSASIFSYLSAFQILIFFGLLIALNWYRVLLLPNRLPVLIPICYYTLGIITAPLSQIPLISAYRSGIGLVFVLTGLVIYKTIVRAGFLRAMVALKRLLIVIFLAGLIGNYLFWSGYQDGFNLLIRGMAGGYTALIGLYIGLWAFVDWLQHKHKQDILIFLSMVAICIRLNSFSAYLSLAFGLFVVLLIYRRYVIALGSFISLVLVGLGFYRYLLSNPETLINNKAAGAYLIGSGRFDIYQAAWDLYGKLPPLKQLFGVGFMAERDLLVSYNLQWVTHTHNSFLTSLLGLGLLGGVLYSLFIVYPFIKVRNLKRYYSRDTIAKWLGFHAMAVFWGISSSDYLAAQSFLIIIMVIFSLLLMPPRQQAKAASAL